MPLLIVIAALSAVAFDARWLAHTVISTPAAMPADVSCSVQINRETFPRGDRVDYATLVEAQVVSPQRYVAEAQARLAVAIVRCEPW